MAETKKKQQKKGASKVKRYFKAKNSRLLAIILLSIMLPAMIFVVAPYEIYCNNISELSFSAKEFIGIQGSFSLLITLIIFAVLYFIPNVVYRFVYPLLFGVLLMLFLQTNYLNGSMNSLAGDGMDSKTPTSTYIWNTSLWLVIIIGLVVLFQFVKIENIAKLIALVLTIAISATQLMNFTITTLNTEGPFASAIDRTYGKYEDKPRFLTYKNIDKFGTDKNVIFICVDRMDGLLYAEPAMEEYPELFAKLDGFTYYSDFVSMYGYTFPSVAYMLSGQKYDNGDQKEHFYRVHNENDTFNVLHDTYGYNVNLYAETYYDYTNANELPSYIGNAMEAERDTIVTKVRRPWKFSIVLTQTALYRSLPFLLKDTVGSVDTNTFNGFVYHDSTDLQGEKSYEYDMKRLRSELLSRDGSYSTGTESKNFSFIHFSGCHANESSTGLGKTDSSVKISEAKKSMELVTDYLDQMKAISPDLYRNSTIVIMADHGVVTKRHNNLSEPMLSACFVKPAGEAETPLSFSDAPVSVSNIWATIFESEGLAYDKAVLGDSFFEIEAKHNADNSYYPVRDFVWTKRNKQLTEYDSITYHIEGSARDFNSWSIYSTEHVSHPLFAH